MQWKRGLLTLILLSLSVGALWAQTSAGDETANLTAFIAKLFTVDRSAVKVESIQPSKLVHGAREATVSMGSNNVMVYIIGDKYLVGNVFDKTYDPLMATMAKMTLRGRPTKGKGPVTIVEFSDFQ